MKGGEKETKKYAKLRWKGGVGPRLVKENKKKNTPGVSQDIEKRKLIPEKGKRQRHVWKTR